jgi:hypothetical protein
MNKPCTLTLNTGNKQTTLHGMLGFVVWPGDRGFVYKNGQNVQPDKLRAMMMMFVERDVEVLLSEHVSVSWITPT